MKTTERVLLTVLATVFFAVAKDDPAGIFERPSPPPPSSKIDKLVYAKLSELTIKPVLCSEAVFLRRAYLDVTGKLPTAEEARSFIGKPYSKNKRSDLIDELLETPEYADYWSMLWADILRIKAEFPINLWPNAAQAYHHWVRTAVAENKPYDQMAREMLTASGSNFRVGEVNFFRAMQNKTPEGIATTVALTFLGARAELWPKERLENMSAFFTQVGYKPTNEWKEECVFWDPMGTTKMEGNAAPGSAKVTTVVIEKNTNRPPALVDTPRPAVFPDGTKVQLPPDRDPRGVFTDWLITPDNPWFSRCIVNRVWFWLLGRGIIHEADDLRDDNPPSNPELLAYLEQEFVRGGYDIKELIRLILNSKVYQFSSVSNVEHVEQFAAYPMRRLEAEVLIDAVNDITGTTDLYTSAIPEPFTYIPKDLPAVAIADGSITSTFLALFGRSARATGMSNERNNTISAPQWRHMLNSGHIQTKLERGPGIRQLTSGRHSSEEIVQNLYLAILSRYPTEEEVATMLSYKAPGGKIVVSTAKKKKQPRKKKASRSKRQSEDWVDVSWALINSTEFLYRH